MRALSEGFQVNTNMTGVKWFSKIFVFWCLDESSFSIGRLLVVFEFFCLLVLRVALALELLRVPQEIVVWNNDTFDNNFVIESYFTKLLMESNVLNNISISNIFSNSAFACKNSSKLLGCF